MSENPTGAGSSLDRLASVDLNLLVPMLALLEERSVTRAAVRVGLSQPAMSHALARMRRLLNDELLVRQGAAMVLTPRAVELLAPVRRALGEAARVVRFPGFDPAVDERVVTVALTTSTAFVLGGELTRLLAERAPHATLRLRTMTVPDEAVFTGHGVDVVLVSEGFVTRHPRERLYDDGIVVVAPADSPSLPGPLDLLTGLPHVVVDTEQPVFPYPVLEENGVPYRVGVRVSDFLLVPYLVGRGAGVALLRRRVARAMADVVDLRIEEFPFPLPCLGIDMVWNPHLVDHDFMAWLRQLLLDAAGPRR